MTVYAETNFVLEIAFVQEQQTSCEQIISLCEAGAITLVMPAYALAEPYETLIRRHKHRRDLKSALDRELTQLARTAFYTQRIHGLQDMVSLLIESTEEETHRLEEIRARLLKRADIIPLDASVLQESLRYQHVHDLSPQDAIVYASVFHHLQHHQPPQSCFLNKNIRDFDDPDIVETLAAHHCKIIPRFDYAHQFILSQIDQE